VDCISNLRIQPTGNPGPEGIFTLTGTGTLIVNAPTLQPAAATGYKVYISSATGTETLQGTVTGWTSVSQSTSLGAGSALPVSNTSACSFRFSDEMIPSGTYYTVNLLNKNGSQIAGYPQTWCTYGGSAATINISNGAPTGLCNVIYPTPVLQAPPNNTVQSISGPLNLGTYSVTAAKFVLTNGSTQEFRRNSDNTLLWGIHYDYPAVGQWTLRDEVNSINQIVCNPGSTGGCSFTGAANLTCNNYAGNDIGAQCNAAITALGGNPGTIVIRPGSYTMTTCISLPSNVIISAYGATVALGSGANCHMIANATANPLKQITSLVRTGGTTVTATTAGIHGYTVNQVVNIWNATPTLSTGETAFPGTFTIASVPSNTTFTYSQNGANDSITGPAAVSLQATGNSGMQVLGGTWDANGNGQSVDVSVVYFENVTSAVIRDVTIKSGNSTYSNRAATPGVLAGAIQCVVCTNGRFDNLGVRDGWDIGMSLALSTNNITTGGHFFLNTLGSGIDDSSGDHNKYVGVDCHNNAGGCLSLNSPYSEVIGGNFDNETGAVSGNGLVMGHVGFPCNGCRATSVEAKGNQVNGISVQGDLTTDWSITNPELEGISTTAPNTFTVATLPAGPGTNALYIVTDGNSGTDCTVGGGSNKVPCYYTGSAYTNYIGSGVSIGTAAAKGEISGGSAKLFYYGVRFNATQETSITGFRSTSNLTYGFRCEAGSGVPCQNNTFSADIAKNNGVAGITGATFGLSLDATAVHNTIIGSRGFDTGSTQTRGIDLGTSTNTVDGNDMTGNTSTTIAGAGGNTNENMINGVLTIPGDSSGNSTLKAPATGGVANTLPTQAGTLSVVSAYYAGAVTGTCSSSVTIFPFLFGGSALTCTDTTGNGQGVLMTSAGTIQNLYVKNRVGGVNASSGVVTIQKNGSGQTVTCTIGTGTSGCNDTGHSFTVVAGDRVTVSMTTQGGETLADVNFSFEKR